MKSLLVTFQPGFESLAERDLRSADPRARATDTLEPGLWRVRPAPDDPDARRLVHGLADAIAIRHLHPVAVDTPVDDLAALVAAIAPLGADLERTLPYAVQTRFVGPAAPRLPKAIAINDAVAESFGALGVPYDRKAPAQVVSLTLAGEHLFAGVSRTADNRSAWPGGARRFARGDTPSRAEHKLLEALEVFALDLTRLVPHGRALDLGAAPGGWTRALAARGLAVTAVDPAALDPAIAALPNVTTYRGTAERYLQTRGAQVDLIVSDMRMDARDAARLLAAYRPLLAPGAHLLATLKLPARGYLGVLDEALAILDATFRRVAARQLFHNRSEVTVLYRASLAS